MNWGEIQIEALKKMFLNNDNLEISKLDEYKKDKKYRTYLFMMPQAANEAINYILENAQPLIKEYILKDSSSRFDLNSLPNFKRLYQVSSESGQPSYRVEGNNQLIVNGKYEEVIIYYESYLDLLDQRTSKNEEIKMNPYLLNLIPLYIAGELYKDDDLQLATIYMNEFLSMVENYKGRDSIYNSNEVITVYNGVF